MESFVLGADHAGYRLKESIANHLRAQGFPVEDVGCFSEASVDYPAISQALAVRLQELQAKASPASPVYGILCCGSGIGVCIAANRFPWVRAVTADDHHTVVMSRCHNDANVLCLGARVIAPELAVDLLQTFVKTSFDGGRHQQRVDLMTSLNGHSLKPVLNVDKQGLSRSDSPEESPLC